QLRADAELLRDGEVLEAPGRHLGENRQQLDALLGETGDRLLLVRGIVRPADYALLDEAFQPVGQDVGGDAFLRLGQQLAEMPAVAEDHVANDEQAPFVTHHFQREVDRTARALTPVVAFCSHAQPEEKPLAFCDQPVHRATSCDTQSVYMKSGRAKTELRRSAQEDHMPKLRVHAFSISLDGYGAGPGQDRTNPLGVGGEEMHKWFVA